MSGDLIESPPRLDVRSDEQDIDPPFVSGQKDLLQIARRKVGSGRPLESLNVLRLAALPIGHQDLRRLPMQIDQILMAYVADDRLFEKLPIAVGAAENWKQVFHARKNQGCLLVLEKVVEGSIDDPEIRENVILGMLRLASCP